MCVAFYNFRVSKVFRSFPRVAHAWRYLTTYAYGMGPSSPLTQRPKIAPEWFLNNLNLAPYLARPDSFLDCFGFWAIKLIYILTIWA